MTSSCGNAESRSSGGTPTAVGSTTAGTSRPAPPEASAYLPDPEPELTVPGPAGSGKLERLTGTWAVGGETGCVWLDTGNGQGVQLIGVDVRGMQGKTLTVEGRRAPGMATTCQEGTPFVVSRVVTAT